MLTYPYTNFAKQVTLPLPPLAWPYDLTYWRDTYLIFPDLLRRFEAISLAQMDKVALLNRTDTKYVLTEPQLYCALLALSEHYWVLDINGLRLNHYQTLYFDTADFALYRCHHAGKQNRYKVRSREYVDTCQSFLEVKLKTNKDRTIKNRLETFSLTTHFTPETDDFMKAHSPFSPQFLEPKLWNKFFRITLVSKHRPERLTLDLNLKFRRDKRVVALPNIAIAEVKQDNANYISDFIQQMRAMNLHPTGFSKYCAGVSLLYQDIKHNNFNPALRLVYKLMRGHSYVQ
jgi:hypothetical protein